MPVNTRNAANRRTVPQVEKSKPKKISGFLLQSLTHTNDENEDEESSSYSDVQSLSMHNQKRGNLNRIKNENNDHVAKKTRTNDIEIEMDENNLFLNHSNHTTHLNVLSPLVQQND
ncbi:unnamed protein product, partial [Rotaria sordida]